MAWLGTPGAMAYVKCSAQESVTAERPVSYSDTIGGRRFAQTGPRAFREWSISLADASRPEDLSVIEAIVSGESGIGPWTWIPDWAEGTNILSARGSIMDTPTTQSGVSPNGGSMHLPEGGVAGRSMIVSPGIDAYFPWVGSREYAPVIPGKRFTASIYTTGPVRMRVRLYRADGTTSRTIGNAWGAGAQTQRLSLSDTPAEDEALALILLISTEANAAFRVARPAVTYTPDLRPWGVGDGAPSVLVSAHGRDVARAHADGHHAAQSFTVTEVGR